MKESRSSSPPSINMYTNHGPEETIAERAVGQASFETNSEPSVPEQRMAAGSCPTILLGDTEAACKALQGIRLAAIPEKDAVQLEDGRLSSTGGKSQRPITETQIPANFSICYLYCMQEST